jgi:hypothetical protein
MALIDYSFKPGIDKQDTTSGAEQRWVDSDNVRFRYGLPEKVGGWSSLVSDTIVGAVRKQHSFVDLDGNRYVALGSDKFLLIYFEGQLHDVTPVKATVSSVGMSCSDATQEVQLTFSSAHNLESGDIILLDNVTVPTSVGLTNAAFEDKLFQVTRVTSSLIAIVTGTQTTTGAGSGGSCDVIPYEKVGPAAQSYGYGFGIGNFGGTVSGVATTTLNGALNADTAGTGGSGTAITLTSVTGFPTGGGIIAVDNELITYTGISSNDLTGITRGTNGTATAGTSNGQAHSNGATVTNATNFSGFGSAVNASTVVLEPGLWSLDNFGQVLIATIANGKTFTWNAGAATPLTTRASTTTSGFATGNNPTASRVTLISPTTRHLIHLGTETTIGDTTTQDDMFIRFSDQEDINTYAPSATNSAGTLRIQDGTKIIGAIKAKEVILIFTDNALYTMKFIGAPFTFQLDQVGTNCGLIGKNAVVEIDGAAFWLSQKGFFLFDGTVKSIPCTVEDFVFDNFDTTKGQQVAAGLNNLFTEITWYYPSSGSTFNDKYVVFNYGESTGVPGGVWYTGTEARTSWMDATIYPTPYATKYSSTADGTFPVVIGQDGLGQTKYFEHEVGTDQVNEDGSTTTVASFIKSFDIDLEQKQRDARGRSSGPKIAGEVFLAMRRFVPDFKNLQGNAKISLAVKRYPQQSDSTTTLSPFTVTSSTDKKDTRARGRFVNVKIENDASNESWRFGTLRLDIQPDGRR